MRQFEVMSGKFNLIVSLSRLHGASWQGDWLNGRNSNRCDFSLLVLSLEALSKSTDTSFRIVDVPVKIRTQHLPNIESATPARSVEI
jgi:hypothetical protein